MPCNSCNCTRSRGCDSRDFIKLPQPELPPFKQIAILLLLCAMFLLVIYGLVFVNKTFE